MRLPRDLSGTELAKALGKVGYQVHLRLNREELLQRLFG